MDRIADAGPVQLALIEPAAVEIAPASAGGGELVRAAAAPPPDRHPAAVYLARLAPGSRRAQATALQTMAAILSGGRAGAGELAWERLRYPHTAALRAQLAARYAPATANRHLAALRGVLGEARRLGLISAEALAAASDLPGVRGHGPPAGRALPAGEIAALFRACAARGGPGGARDAALLALLYGAGLRRSEAVALDLADADRDSGALTVRSGKGRAGRIAYLASGGRRALAAWVDLRGPQAGPLVVAVNRGGRVDPGLGRLSGQAVLEALRRRAAQAGVEAFSPHDLRRSFIGDLLDAGADLATVQRLAGHAGPATTARYDRRPEQAKRRAAELLHVPYVG